MEPYIWSRALLPGVMCERTFWRRWVAIVDVMLRCEMFEEKVEVVRRRL